MNLEIEEKRAVLESIADEEVIEEKK